MDQCARTVSMSWLHELARRAVGRCHDLAQILQAVLGERGHVGAGLGPAQHRGQRHEEEIGQVVPRVGPARITRRAQDREGPPSRARPRQVKALPNPITRNTLINDMGRPYP